jgi:hypothetical protein
MRRTAKCADCIFYCAGLCSSPYRNFFPADQPNPSNSYVSGVGNDFMVIELGAPADVTGIIQGGIGVIAPIQVIATTRAPPERFE